MDKDKFQGIILKSRLCIKKMFQLNFNNIKNMVFKLLLQGISLLKIKKAISFKTIHNFK
jgi:hypothetical protein